MLCIVDEQGNCKLVDFFNNEIDLYSILNDTEKIRVSPYSYLRCDNYWEKIDNIYYEGIVPFEAEISKENDLGYKIANYDMLYMISASDAVYGTDMARSKKLLDEAYKLNQWLINNDVHKDFGIIHFINKMQIIKRQRPYDENEIEKLKTRLQSQDLPNYTKAGLYLLLDAYDEFDKIFKALTINEQCAFKNYPIWRFYRPTINAT